ncbi:MAG: hypothetical protein IJF23_04845, partial [Clostridia bacterium]|nr:hypothetical protein [Clostridia bacterium]
MNIKKIFITSLRTVERSKLPQLRSGIHTVRAAAVSLGSFFSEKGWKKLSDKDGYVRIYDIASDFFGFGGKADIIAFEKYLHSVSVSYDLSGAEISSVVAIFKLAALEKLAYYCEKYEADREKTDSLGNISELIACLAFFEKYDGDDLYAKLSKCERILCRDTAYSELDKESKNIYRHRISVLAKKRGIPESVLAEEITEKAASAVGKRAHVGYYLFEQKNCRFYIPLTFILPAVVSAVIGIAAKSVLASVFSYLPVFEITKIIIDRIVGTTGHAEYVPRLNKCEKKTLVTIVTFLSSPADVDKYTERLKQLYYTNKNPDGNILFGFLADLPESSGPTSTDDELIVSRVKERIEKLNCELENVFFAAVRNRSYNRETGQYSGYERKRGAICDFLSTVKSYETERFLFVSDNVFDAEYFVSLDSDTRPEPESVSKLIKVLSHPLSEPVFNSEMTAVKDGYAVAVPRIDVDLKSAHANTFTKIISCSGGTEVYENVSFDLYHDL